MKIPSSEHEENVLCTEIVFDIQDNFCTQHVLPMFCKKKSFWQRFTCKCVTSNDAPKNKNNNATLEFISTHCTVSFSQLTTKESSCNLVPSPLAHKVNTFTHWKKFLAYFCKEIVETFYFVIWTKFTAHLLDCARHQSWKWVHCMTNTKK